MASRNVLVIPSQRQLGIFGGTQGLLGPALPRHLWRNGCNRARVLLMLRLIVVVSMPGISRLWRVGHGRPMSPAPAPSLLADQHGIPEAVGVRGTGEASHLLVREPDRWLP